MSELPLLLLALGLGAAPLLAQSDVPVHATVYYNKQDGTRKSTVTDPEKGTSEETVTDAQGKVKYRVTYLLDEQGQAIGSINYDAKGTIQYRTSFKRDGENRVDEEDVSDPNGQLLRRRVYTYGLGNKVLNIVEYDGRGNIISDGRRRAATVKKALPVKR